MDGVLELQLAGNLYLNFALSLHFWAWNFAFH